MKYGICVVPVMSLRAEPSHKSEIISQLIFGECFEMYEKINGTWVRIKCRYDGYEGWCTLNHAAIIDDKLYVEGSKFVTGEWVNHIMVNGHPMKVPLGSVLQGMKSGKANWGKVLVEYKGNILEIGKEKVTERLIKYFAYQFLNTAYLWGGKSVFGVDCSGFTQTVYRLLGIKLPRDAWQQAKEGEVTGFLQSARCGDLAFFDNEEGRITHTGILLNNFEIIHSSGKVRVDKIDTEGIINGDTGLRTHHLRIVKRYF
jgi:gamma-D-glutamyl-L-lysine dipeptidyl-peptidase